MKKFSVISIDMFQTLVDVNSRRNNIWKRILGNNYTIESAEKYSNYINECVYKRFPKDTSSLKEFSNLKTIFTFYFQEVFNKIKIDFSPVKASKIWANEHNYALSYFDSKNFFDIFDKSIPICLVSDSDIDMIYKQIKKFRFNKTFIYF